MQKRRSYLQGKQSYKETSDAPFLPLILVIFLLFSLVRVQPASAAGVFGSTSGSSISSGSVPSVGNGAVADGSMETSTLDERPLERPVAVILLSSSTGIVHHKVYCDGSQSYIQQIDTASEITTDSQIGDDPEGSENLNQTNTGENSSTNNSLQSPQQNLPLSSYTWDFGDTTQAQGASVEHIYQDTGIYTITLVVQDDKNNTNSTNTTIAVIPEQITDVTITNPGTGGTLLLQWTPLSENQVIYYQIYRDDRTEPFTTIHAKYQDSGLINDHTYSYTIAAVDYADTNLFIGPQSDKKSAVPTLNNILPITNAGGPYFAWLNQPLCLDASTSKDIDGAIINYHWNFGDGTQAAGKVVQHTYTKPGTYVISLTTTDNTGATNTDTTLVTVTTTTQMVIANIHSPDSGVINTPVTFYATISASFIEKNLDFLWDFGDGYTDAGVSTNHCYSTVGTYTITLAVTNEAGLSSTNSTNITIQPVQIPPTQPLVTITSKDTTPQRYQLSIVSYDQENQQLRYQIDWGDHTTMQSPWFPSGILLQASHTWDTPGTYRITVNVEDETHTLSETTETMLAIPFSETANTIQTQQNSRSSFFSFLSQTSSEVSIIFLVVILILIEGVFLGFLGWKIKRR